MPVRAKCEQTAYLESNTGVVFERRVRSINRGEENEEGSLI